jgi:Fic family protein
LIVSYDSIMKPPYDISPKILESISSISVKLGEVKANFLNRPSPQLRKENRIKTIHSSLSIEGNTLSQEQITAILENKRVLGPKNDIIEVLNANKAYNNLRKLDPYSVKSFLSAHKILMHDLLEYPGKFKSKDIGIIHGSKVAHVAPEPENVPVLMNDLFNYLKNDKDLLLIKSCVFHYETEFIHPFTDGNGRMGRLWQTLILMQNYPVFEYIPFESVIKETQNDYYEALKTSDNDGKSTVFIEYMLDVIDKTLEKILQTKNINLTDIERIEHFLSQSGNEFTRKDYMNVFKSISPATASRDLKKAVEMKLILKKGSKNKTVYKKQPGTGGY